MRSEALIAQSCFKVTFLNLNRTRPGHCLKKKKNLQVHFLTSPESRQTFTASISFFMAGRVQGRGFPFDTKDSLNITARTVKLSESFPDPGIPNKADKYLGISELDETKKASLCQCLAPSPPPLIKTKAQKIAYLKRQCPNAFITQMPS